MTKNATLAFGTLLAVCFVASLYFFRSPVRDNRVAPAFDGRQVTAITRTKQSQAETVAQVSNPDTSSSRRRNESRARTPDSPLDIQAELATKFDAYDDRIAAGIGPIPLWWGKRDIYKDIAAVDSKVIVMGVTCAPDICAVDVYHPHLPPQGDFDSRIVNQPAFQGGGYTRRYQGDPTRMRIYVLAADLEVRDEGAEFPPKEKQPVRQ